MKTLAGRKLSRKPGHRLSLFRNMAMSLLQYEKVQTTLPKAKEVSKFTEKVITAAKKGGLNSQRRVARTIHQENVRKKLFDVLVPRYLSRNGGYTQIIRLAPRTGDAAKMVVIRLLP